jgi:hypothetical protein
MVALYKVHLALVDSTVPPIKYAVRDDAETIFFSPMEHHLSDRYIINGSFSR